MTGIDGMFQPDQPGFDEDKSTGSQCTDEEENEN